uniref:Uncharacterized protein n=1 Tax=viral metagenome TaxID=1070528 RepID=A0A6C0KRJ7_9ZZZZ
MAVKIKKSGHYLSKVNGQPIINNEYAVDIDSERKKNKQVLGMFKSNGIVNTMHDSLQSYMNKMSSKNQSIFDLLKNERNELSKIPNSVMKISDSPPKSIMPKSIMPIMPTMPSMPINVMTNAKKMIMKNKTRKLNNGISSKLFDFTNIEQAPDPNPKPKPKPKSRPKPRPRVRNINISRKKIRTRASRRNRKRL